MGRVVLKQWVSSKLAVHTNNSLVSSLVTSKEALIVVIKVHQRSRSNGGHVSTVLCVIAICKWLEQ